MVIRVLKGQAVLYTRVSSHPRQEWSGGALVLGKFQCQAVLLIWIRVGQGPSALAVGAGGGCLEFFLLSITSLFFLPLSGRRSDID